MIRIGNPYLTQTKNGKVQLVAFIIDDVYGWQQNLWYEVESEYGGFLCDTTSDSFVLALLTIAVASGQDIKVEGAVSTKLLYHLENTLIPLYTKFFYKDKPISVEADMFSRQDCDGDAVATGCSLGIDSLSTIYKHIAEPVSSGYKLTHLTFFNCGQLGDEGVDEWMKNALFRACPDAA